MPSSPSTPDSADQSLNAFDITFDGRVTAGRR
jgi:hypothetical protein